MTKRVTKTEREKWLSQWSEYEQKRILNCPSIWEITKMVEQNIIQNILNSRVSTKTNQKKTNVTPLNQNNNNHNKESSDDPFSSDDVPIIFDDISSDDDMGILFGESSDSE